MSPHQAGVTSGVGISPQPALLLPSIDAVAPRDALRLLWRSCCGKAVEKPPFINAVAVLRLHGEGRRSASLVRSDGCGPLFDTAKMERDRVKAMETTDDDEGNAANTVARGTRYPSLASHTDIPDRHITVVSWSMVGGLEIGLALKLRRLRSVAGLVASRSGSGTGKRHHLQTEDIFLTPRA